MDIKELSSIMKENGVVGAGGAGFPSYAKLNEKADTLILNCAECEPLLKLHRQVMEKYAYEICTTLELIANAVGAKRVIIAIKGSYKGAIDAIKKNMPSLTKTEIGILPEIYPAGDEVITIYETTGRVVPPGSIPIEVGVIVYNVETVLNVYKAMNNEGPVVHKYVTVAGEVNNPVTLKAPLGITVNELVLLAGGSRVINPVFIGGGPMTGPLVDGTDTITKTSNAILVFSPEHSLIKKKQSKNSINLQRAKSVCCQCQMCTDLCPRNLIGHPIAPHQFMRVVSNSITNQTKPYLDTFFCSACGVCEMFACPQGLSPRSLIAQYKDALRGSGVAIPKGIISNGVNSAREYRRVPMSRLTARLGLTKYNLPAPLLDEVIPAKMVKIKITQHIGAPSEVCVFVNERVQIGQVIAKAGEGKLGVNTHASIDGIVIAIDDKYITIQSN